MIRLIIAANLFFVISSASVAHPSQQIWSFCENICVKKQDVAKRQPAKKKKSKAAPVELSEGQYNSIEVAARRYIGSGPIFGRTSLWCARFMNYVLKETGYSGTGSDLAKSFAKYGRKINEPKIGAIAVMWRGNGGGHVGVVSGFDKNGRVKVISGNHNNRVAEAFYPRGRIYAFVVPA